MLSSIGLPNIRILRLVKVSLEESVVDWHCIVIATQDEVEDDEEEATAVDYS